MLSNIARSASRTSFSVVNGAITSKCRFSTTSSSSNEEKPSSSSQVYLNPERKRKLISLYHQAGNFLNYDNLSDKIDDAFRQQLSGVVRMEVDSKPILDKELKEGQRKQSKFVVATAGDRSGFSSDNPSWAKKWDLRERRVRAALFGLDDSGRAGLETVEPKLRLTPKEKKDSE